MRDQENLWNACGVHTCVGVMLCEVYVPITCVCTSILVDVCILQATV